MRYMTMLICVVLSLVPVAAFGQAWNIDARTIGLAGVGGDQNIFATTVAEDRGDRSIVLPFGLIQTLQHFDVFKPSSPEFDPSGAVEYASNPMHLQFGRTRSSASAAFVFGVRNAQLSHDLNDYRGFVPVSLTANGLIAPRWGRTFELKTDSNGLRHSLYAGAGPHLALHTAVAADPVFSSVLDSDAPTYVPNHRFSLDNQSTGQLSAAITGGYRGRYPLRGAPNDAAFVSANVNYLHGFRYEDVDLALHLNTDATGQLISTVGGYPLSFVRNAATRGRGVSLDLGGGVVFGPWELGASANNLAHRMTWRNTTQRFYGLRDLFSGFSQFETGPRTAIANVRTKLPTDVRGNVAFRGQSLSFHGEVASEWHELSFRGGVEHARDRVEFRLATAYSQRAWYPTGGLSIGLTPRFWLDLAGFTTSANVERQRRYAVATSIRFRPAGALAATPVSR